MSWNKTKRSPRCSYCYQQGHARNHCPTAKQQAAAGDGYAQKVVERGTTKKCSYCGSTEHIKTVCEKKHSDEVLQARKEWVGILAAVECVKQYKLGAGAFVYGPLMYYANALPETDTLYELVNYTITDIKASRPSYFTSETTSMIRCETLAESQNNNYSFRNLIPIPGFYEAVVCLKTEYVDGQKEWLRSNQAGGYSGVIDGRRNLKELTQVILPATDEEVDKVVNSLLAIKPEILNYPDRKSYQKAMRALKKEKTEG